MAYRVELTRGAEADLEELYLWVVERAPNQGAAWFNGLEETIFSLDRHPERCPLAPEGFDPERPVRVLHYGRARHVYFDFDGRRRRASSLRDPPIPLARAGPGEL